MSEEGKLKRGASIKYCPRCRAELIASDCEFCGYAIEHRVVSPTRRFDPEIGARMRYARQQLDMKQHEVAALLGVSRPSIANWETGHAVTTVDRFLELCRLYGVSADWVLGLDKDRR